MATKVELPLYVLVGGASRRFGSDKASHLRDGVPWALHVGKSLGGVTDSDLPQDSADSVPFAVPEIVLVGSLSNAALADSQLNELRNIPDELEQVGPFGGLLAAVKDRHDQFGPGLLAIASCDLVDPKPSWLVPLVAAHLPSEPKDDNEPLELAAYHDEAGKDRSVADGGAMRWQPFPSVAHTCWLSSLNTIAVNSVAESLDFSLQRLYQNSNHQQVAWQQAKTTAPPQANTRSELDKLLGETD